MVVVELAIQHLLQVLFHLSELLSESFKCEYLIIDILGELAKGSVLDVSKQMLDSDLFGLRSPNGASDVHELPVEVAVAIYLLLSVVGFRGDAQGVCLVQLDYHKDGIGVVLANLLVDVDVCLFNGGTC